MRYCIIEKQNEEVIENSLHESDFFHKGTIGNYILDFLSCDFSSLEEDLRDEFNSIKIRNKKHIHKSSYSDVNILDYIEPKDRFLDNNEEKSDDIQKESLRISNDTDDIDDINILDVFEYSDCLKDYLSKKAVKFSRFLEEWYDYYYFDSNEVKFFGARSLKKYLEKCVESEFWSDYETFIIACEIGFFPLPGSHLEHRDMANYIFGDNSDDAFSRIEKTKNSLIESNQSLILVYECNNAREVAIASLLEVFRHGYKIKKCMNCNRYFIAYNRSDAIYCDNISPQDETRTCKEYGSQKLWYDRLKNDEAKKLARNIYMAKQMLVKRNPDIADYETSFEKYKLKLKQWKADVKSGVKTEAEYIKWLKAVQGKKVL